MWYVVQGTEYVVRGMRHEVQDTLYDYPTKRTSPRNSLYKVEGAELEVQNTRYEVRDTGCEVRGTRCEVRGAGYGACGARYEVCGAGSMVQVTRGHK